MKLQKIMFKHQWHALFDNMSHLVTYLLYNTLFFLSLYLPLPSPGTPALTTSMWFSDNLFYCFDLALAMNYPCMLPKMSRECAVWNNNAVHTLCSLSCSLLSSPSSRCVCLSLWCRHWKTLRHKFVLFLCLEGTGAFFPSECSRMLIFPSVLERTTVAMCQTNGNIFVSYYWIL